MAEYDENDCTCIGENAVILRELRLVEVMEENGEIFKIDLSHNGADGPLPFSDMLEMCEWVKAISTSEIVADLVHQRLFGEEEDED